MFAWENSGFSLDASVRIAICRPQLRVYFQHLEHLLRYCARPPFALEQPFVIRGEDGRIARVRSLLPQHKVGSWIGPGDRRPLRRNVPLTGAEKPFFKKMRFYVPAAET